MLSSAAKLPPVIKGLWCIEHYLGYRVGGIQCLSRFEIAAWCENKSGRNTGIDSYQDSRYSKHSSKVVGSSSGSGSSGSSSGSSSGRGSRKRRGSGRLLPYVLDDGSLGENINLVMVSDIQGFSDDKKRMGLYRSLILNTREPRKWFYFATNPVDMYDADGNLSSSDDGSSTIAPLYDCRNDVLPYGRREHPSNDYKSDIRAQHGAHFYYLCRSGKRGVRPLHIWLNQFRVSVVWHSTSAYRLYKLCDHVLTVYENEQLAKKGLDIIG